MESVTTSVEENDYKFEKLVPNRIHSIKNIFSILSTKNSTVPALL